MRVLFESSAVLAVDKPAGVTSIADRFGAPGLVDALQAERGERLWVVHRLDREVTGVIVFARTAAAHRALSLAVEGRAVAKRYEAWCEGDAAAGATFRWDSPLLRGKKRSYVHPAGKPALTLATCAGPAAAGLVRIDLWPQTGRNHQLRVHLANAGLPIAGDILYGAEAAWRPGEIALRAVELTIPAGVVGPAPLALWAGGLAPP